MKKCPYCAEEIQDEAIKCKHCGEQVAKMKTDYNASNKLFIKFVIGIPMAVVVFTVFWMIGRYLDGEEFSLTRKEDLIAQVKKSIQEDHINKNEAYKGLFLGEVVLVKETSNKYAGYIDYKKGNETERVQLEVIKDRGEMMYRFEPPRALIMETSLAELDTQMKESLDELDNQLYQLKRKFKNAILNGKPINWQMIDNMKKYQLLYISDAGLTIAGITVGEFLEAAFTAQLDGGDSLNLKVEKNSTDINLIFETRKENASNTTILFCKNIDNQGVALLGVAVDNDGKYVEEPTSAAALQVSTMLYESFQGMPRRKPESNNTANSAQVKAIIIEKSGDAEDLISAVGKGDTSTVKALLAGGTDVNAKANEGVTALMIACYGGHLDIVQALLAAGADVNVKAKDGETALSLAKVKGHSDISQLLIKTGAKE